MPVNRIPLKSVAMRAARLTRAEQAQQSDSEAMVVEDVEVVPADATSVKTETKSEPKPQSETKTRTKRKP